MAAAPTQYSREELARREIGVTAVRPGTAALLASLLLATLYAVPLLQHIESGVDYARGVTASPWPPCYRLAGVVDGAPAAFRQAGGGWARRAVATNRRVLQGLRRYEDTLQEASWLSRVFLPPSQGLLWRVFHAGNEKVAAGRGDWLFYRPNVDYLTGPGFLGRRHAAERRKARKEWEPLPASDPLPAIVAFDRQLRARGIRLLVVPTPVKPALQPDKLWPGCPSGAPLENASFETWRRRLEEAGIAVFDPTAVLREMRDHDRADVYLRGDTHWRPEAMERVARALTDRIAREVELSPAATPPMVRRTVNLAATGDLRARLRLPPGCGGDPLEDVRIHPVAGADGAAWRPDRAAEVLLLGDSFSNIYSLPSLGWGAGAGLAEQLSFFLQRPLDRLAQNDQGAAATREMFWDEEAAAPGRWSRTRVVVWQFAARELALGDWRALGPAP